MDIPKREIKTAIDAAFGGRPIDNRGALEREITNYVSSRWPTVEVISLTWDRGHLNVMLRERPRLADIHIDIEATPDPEVPPDNG